MSETTRAKIVAGATVALAANGERRFTMSEVCDHAGVSRGTLYRYFTDREQLRAAVRRHVVTTLEQSLATAVQARPEIEHRVRVVLQTLSQHTTRHPELRELVAREPALALSFLTAEFPSILSVVTDALRPALRECAAVATGALTDRQVAEILLRLMITGDLVPSRGSRALAQRTADLWESFVGTASAMPVRIAS
jgi:AcrR family transcriptional regulator